MADRADDAWIETERRSKKRRPDFTLSPAERMRRKKEYDREHCKSRIYIGTAIKQWRQLKDRANMGCPDALRDEDWANILLKRFVTLKKEKEFGNEEKPLINSKSRIQYEDSQPNILPHIGYNGIPFIIAGRKVLECHQGKDREKGRKEKRRKEIQKEGNKDHNFIRKRNLIQPTKKKNCPAKIRIRHIIRFPDFKELEDKCRLFGIIIHQGSSISTGHYYCFLEFGGQWFRIDDMKIRKVSVPEVNLCMDQSYMLFYRALPRPYIS